MKKGIVFFIILFACPLIAGAYGMLHDQLTYTISPEYYTKFKFITFNVPEGMSERLRVCIVGFKAAWWTGVPIGMIMAPLGLIHRDERTMLRVSFKAIGIVLLVTIITGLIGLFYGEFFLATHCTSPVKIKEYFDGWFIPDDVRDYKNYISVGSMHNFTYLGGAFGLIVAAAYHLLVKSRYKKLVK